MNPYLALDGNHVMVTGGAGALGASIVASLRGHGASVTIVDIIDEADAHGRFGSFTYDLCYRRADVTDEEQVRELFDAFTLDGLPATVCVNAGMTHAAAVEDYPLDVFDALMRLNMRGSYLIAREAARRWIAADRSGHLIFTTSWVQDAPWPRITPYAASKAGLRALMRGFAHELAPHGIRANAVAPGIVAAGMALEQWQSDPTYRTRTARAVPRGALQPPSSIGDTFAFLCSDLAIWMNGATLVVDGGASLYPYDNDEESEV